jgi:hypothetical protein
MTERSVINAAAVSVKTNFYKKKKSKFGIGRLKRQLDVIKMEWRLLKMRRPTVDKNTIVNPKQKILINTERLNFQEVPIVQNNRLRSHLDCVITRK